MWSFPGGYSLGFFISKNMLRPSGFFGEKKQLESNSPWKKKHTRVVRVFLTQTNDANIESYTCDFFKKIHQLPKHQFGSTWKISSDDFYFASPPFFLICSSQDEDLWPQNGPSKLWETALSRFNIQDIKTIDFVTLGLNIMISSVLNNHIFFTRWKKKLHLNSARFFKFSSVNDLSSNWSFTQFAATSLPFRDEKPKKTRPRPRFSVAVGLTSQWTAPSIRPSAWRWKPHPTSPGWCPPPSSTSAFLEALDAKI